MNHRYWPLLAGALLLASAAQAQTAPPAPATPLTLPEQIVDFFARLLSPTGFPARWHCGQWTDFHGWLYIASDLLIWSAYFVIPFLLVNFIRRRPDMPFDRLFWLFGLFIFACGATHLLDAVIFWTPLYRLSAVVRLVTAVASWGTVLALVGVLPRALLLRTPAELERIVQARTAELAAANAQLQALAEQLSQRTAELEAVADGIPQLAWMAEPDGAINWYNQRWYEYTGTTLEEMRGWGWEKVHDPDHLAGVVQGWQRQLAAGQPWEDTFPLRRHDGEYRWFLSRAFPVRHADGQLARWFGTNTDITDLILMQEQVQRSEVQYRVLMESIPQLIWTADAAGQLTYCDARTADYTGRPADQWPGQPWTALLHPADQLTAQAHWEAARHEGGLLAGEYRLRRADGQYRWFLVQARRLEPGQPSTAQWFGTCTDIHQQHVLRETLQGQNAELARTNRDLDSFVYAASHDLKQPVYNLSGLFAELRRDARFADSEAGLMLGMANEALEQLTDTVQALADVVQVQRDADQLPPEPVQLRPLAEEVIRSLPPPPGAAPAWELDFGPISAVVAVRAHLRSVLYNLLSNAVKYADPARAPRIRVATELEEGMPVLVVQDNGLGINLERHGRDMFQLFRRFHDHVPGSGIGLYLVQRLVEQAGGRLVVESEVGRGTTFRVYLQGR